MSTSCTAMLETAAAAEFKLEGFGAYYSSFSIGRRLANPAHNS